MKKKTKKKNKKRNPTDTTLRNNRARQKEIDGIKKEIRELWSAIEMLVMRLKP